MNIRKVTPEQWAFEIDRALKVREVQHQRIKQAKYHYFQKYLSSFMPLPIIIGVAAAVTLFILYGSKEFFKFFLSWIVSLTIVATGAFYVWKYYEKQI